ncbi:MAG TPA: PQQ-binding-like beta-propeller repeat protein [Gemmataceae bacterium]|jgi:outer membrane protein assembly factor BamB|nr:PQQ-binding-like beta-propeller repeat protein [Gemmataceae bacterium]
MKFRLLAFALMLPALPLLAGDWAVHRGNATQTGVSDEKLPEKLALRWEYKTRNSVESAAVIADGIVYAASSDKHLYAIDLKTGTLKWKTPGEGPEFCFGTVVFDLMTERLRPNAFFSIFTASPGVNGNRLYVGDADGKFFCIDRATGNVLWAFDDDEQTGQISAAPNFDGDNILIPTQNSVLYCLNKNGKKLWDFRIEGPIYGGVAVADGKTYLAGCDSLMHAIDIKTGKELGSVDLKGQSGSAAAVFGDFLYVGTMSNQVLAVNLKRMRIEWEFEAPKRKQSFYGSAAVDDELVVIGSRDSKVWAIDRKSGKRHWDYLTDNKVDGSAVIVGDRVFIGSYDKRFYVFDRKGKKVDEFELDGAIMGSPAVADGCVVIGTDKGTVYCFGAKR